MTTVADLTPRQLAVASLVARCRTTKQIAVELGVSEQRVRVLVTAIAFRTQCAPGEDERVHVALWYREHVPISLQTYPPAA